LDTVLLMSEARSDSEFADAIPKPTGLGMVSLSLSRSLALSLSRSLALSLSRSLALSLSRSLALSLSLLLHWLSVSQTLSRVL